MVCIYRSSVEVKTTCLCVQLLASVPRSPSTYSNFLQISGCLRIGWSCRGRTMSKIAIELLKRATRASYPQQRALVPLVRSQPLARQMATIPIVIESTGRGERAFDIYSSRVRKNLSGVESAKRYIGLTIFPSIYSSQINMYINSPGGVVTAGLAIYDTMQYIDCPISTLCVGQAASMSLASSNPHLSWSEQRLTKTSRVALCFKVHDTTPVQVDHPVYTERRLLIRTRRALLVTSAGLPLAGGGCPWPASVPSERTRHAAPTQWRIPGGCWDNNLRHVKSFVTVIHRIYMMYR
eukprot:1179584-Prorocentrum_minimum.AAC.2